MTERERVIAALRDEFEAWIANAPNAGLFDWNVAADNVLRAIADDNLVRAAKMAVEAYREQSAGYGDPDGGPEALEALGQRLGHSQECEDAAFIHHAATGGDLGCTCGSQTV